MATRPRIIIADTDCDYVTLLEFKFVEELFDKVNLEIITDQEYFTNLFSIPQNAQVLIVSDEFYTDALTMHNNIEHIFLITENSTDDQQQNKNVIQIYKYSSVNMIYDMVAGASGFGKWGEDIYQKPQVVVFFSATGGVGKTLLSMAVASNLSEQFRRVLYINAAYLQTFQQYLKQQTPILAIDTYAKLSSPSTGAYPILKDTVRKEQFFYIPPFKASLVALGMSYTVYQELAVAAKKTGEYDFIIVDAETGFHEDNSKLLSIADRVVFVLNQGNNSVEATNLMANNINDINSEKHTFICNNFDKNKENVAVSGNKKLQYSIDEYVRHIEKESDIGYEELAKEEDVKKIAMFLMASLRNSNT